MNLKLSTPLVDIDYLHRHIDADNLILLDATMASAGQKDFTVPDHGILGARHIDIKNNFADRTATLPNMLPNTDEFTKSARALGIHSDSAIVVYDQRGIYSSPRVWWMFRSMGHKNIAVLDGGYPAWQKHQLPTGELNTTLNGHGNFTACYMDQWRCDKNQVLQSTSKANTAILDARSNGRFHGTSPEPRDELRSGNIPSSHNLPYSELLNDGFFLPAEELKNRINPFCHRETDEIIFTCGSGITACILHLGAEIAGINNSKVYDGSWSEWGLK